MDFSVTSEQQALQDSVRRFCEREYGFEQRKALLAAAGFSERNWTTFAELGWLGAGLPEETGGFGGGPIETMLIQEQLGRALVLEPFLPAIMVLQAIAGLDSTLVPLLIAGEKRAALADGEAVAAHSGGRLQGRARFVLGGPQADILLVPAREESGIGLFQVAAGTPGLARVDYHAVDGRRVSDFIFREVEAETRLGDALPALDRARDHGVMALCAEAVGAMEAALWQTRDYLKTRKQFGVTLNSFQALQHRMADMLIETELARSMLYRGTAALIQGDRRTVAAAKAQIGEAGFFVGSQAIQLHGGIGLTEELMVGHCFKRLTLVRGLWGSTDAHLARFAAG